MRRHSKPPKTKAPTHVRKRNRALMEARAQLIEALEQQTATSQILRVISESPTDVQPVLHAVSESAARLCNAIDAQIFRVDGDLLRLVASHGPLVQPDQQLFIGRGSVTGRSVVERRTIHIHDLAAEVDIEFPDAKDNQTRVGHRTTLATPLMHRGIPLGAILIRRLEVEPFTVKQIELLKTFADQAVIAIENVRLFKESETRNQALTEALEQQTATADILQVISGLPTDVQPVFNTIVSSAPRLCGAKYCLLYQFDGDLLHLVAHHNVTGELLDVLHRLYPMRPSRQHAVGRAIMSAAVVEIADALSDPEYQQKIAVLGGWRSMVAVPMLRDGAPIGAIVIQRAEAGAFPERQIALLRTFADQAVISVENVRLFKALQAKTQELTRSVGQLTALDEVGRAVGSTLDLDTVLTTIVSRAVQLSSAAGGSIYEYDEALEEFALRATHNLDAPDVELRRAIRLKKGEGATGRMAIIHEPVQLPDISVEGAYDSRLREALLRAGAHAVLAVPLLCEDQLIGSLVVSRNTPGMFPSEVVELLRTFATQSALAIRNARLFREIADKSRQLEVTSQHKSEFLANMSHELRTPLNAILGFSEVLAQGMFGPVNDKQAEYLRDILDSGRHLLSLINDILDLSKIEAGRMVLEMSDFDLPQAIQNALTLVRERALRRGIALRHAIDERVGAIRADDRKIKQILLNLLSNAIKFTPEGGRIEVRAAPADEHITISVTDTGIGIAPGDLEAVFEEFRQVGTADRKAEGTGLGLALARKFVELHGGRIGVTSRLGEGSTFTVTLPVRLSGEDPARAMLDAPSPPA